MHGQSDRIRKLSLVFCQKHSCCNSEKNFIKMIARRFILYICEITKLMCIFKREHLYKQ